MPTMTPENHFTESFSSIRRLLVRVMTTMEPGCRADREVRTALEELDELESSVEESTRDSGRPH
jgi:hypothetical protein